jgi:two-component system, NarL family, invasion response regulator UvrY
MIRALIADDHAVVRRGLREMLGESEEIAVEGEASDAREVMDLVRGRDWDVLVLDLNLPDSTGLDLLQRVKEERPKLPVLILTICSEDEFAIRALRCGAAGYLTKKSAPEELVAAVQKVVAGGRYVSPALAERLAFFLDGSLERPPHDRLSDREFQVFRMLTSGRTSAQTADALNLSVKTVSTYRARILEKMNMRTNAELAVYAARHDLID